MLRLIALLLCLVAVSMVECGPDQEVVEEINEVPSLVKTVSDLEDYATTYLSDGNKDRKSTSQPNIVYILMDDLGYNDLGYQNPDVLTPNIDELANTGLILDYNYVAPVCTPSRHTLMTGTYAWKHGMAHLVLAENNPVCSPLNLKFLPERLQEAGYQTHMMGKWHLGYCDQKCTPPARGFDSFIGLYGGQGSYYTHSVVAGYDWHKDGKLDFSANNTYSTDLIKDRGVELLSDMDLNRPFFWFVSHMAPHTPLEVDPESFAQYSGKTFSDDTTKDTARKMYLAMITRVDQGIGELVAEMKARQVYDNTVFIFSSDNGGEFGAFQQADNSPLRGGKATMFEGGSRVAGFVHSALLPQSMQGQRLQEIIHEADWVPTLTRLATGTAASDAILDGYDQYDTIFNGAPSPRTEVVYNIDMAFPQIFGQAAIRVNEWKLIWGHYGFSDGYANQTYGFWMTPPSNKRDISKRSWAFDPETEARMMGIIIGNNFDKTDVNSGTAMLFNLDNDPTETTDLSGDPAYSSKVLELKNRLLDHINNGYVNPDPGYNINENGHDILAEYGGWTYGWCEK